MSDIAITVENLSKLYRIGAKQQRRETFFGALTSLVKSPITNYRKLRRLTHFDHNTVSRCTSASGQAAVSKDDLVWALESVSVEVKQGEVIGIIGRNGAGKSTLLKILSRITEPTIGRALISGRVASLLEVGTGFHAELTGRENIYLNGTILGMTRKEVGKKFDEIIAFAEVGRFMDTPVKYYSSGMYVRLAFAVAAHLESEVLLVDEVLAVGDAGFQKKCLGKMGDIARDGRTVLFVSHNMQTIQRLCSRSLLFEKGSILADGPTTDVISQYLTDQTLCSAQRVWESSSRSDTDRVIEIRSVRAIDASGQVLSRYDIRKPIYVELTYQTFQQLHGVAPGIHVYDREGICLFMSYDHNCSEWESRVFSPGRYRSICQIPGNLLAEGHLSVTVAINTEVGQSVCHVFEPQVIVIEVFDPFEGDSVRGTNSNTWGGVVRPMLQWETGGC